MSMVYVTVKQAGGSQMSLEELLFSTESPKHASHNQSADTRTYVADRISRELRNRTDVGGMVGALSSFNEEYKSLFEAPRESLYNTFYVAKKGKGMPGIFQRIFALQKKYIDCDTKPVFREIAKKLHPLLSEHSTQEDSALTNTVAEECTALLCANGFVMTRGEFLRILAETHRRIDAPKQELKAALSSLKDIFEYRCGALYHTSAFAYVKGRSTVDAVRRHQANESRWFCKLDLSNFFGSTTVDFILKMFAQIHPFAEIMEVNTPALKQALSLCVLGGVLPQGTPISPTITNIMMIPIDHKLSNTLRHFDEKQFVYTRYADDFLISSRIGFDFHKVEQFLNDTLSEFDAPFTINTQKTRYGSSAGSNWNLGVMLNRENKITVGHEKKRRFQAMVSSYVMDKLHGKDWDKSEIQKMEGYRSYYTMIEGDTIDRIITHLGEKFSVDIPSMIRRDLTQ